jgi:hypothetical protein
MKRKGLPGCVSALDGDANLLFPPAHATPEAARTALLHVIRRTPEHFGYRRSRWTLAMLRSVCGWLRVHTDGGMSHLLRRLHISYKRGREYVHSPDAAYMTKVQQVALCRRQVEAASKRYALLYLDEVTYYRQPSVARAYAPQGHEQVLAHRSHRSNTQRRIVATLDALTGQVCYRQWAHINRWRLVDFYAEVCAAYADKETIFLVVDNWPVHYHPDVMACLAPQQYLMPPNLPPNWPTQATRQPRYSNLPLQLLSLPTYASWLNPIEKLWRWLKQEILHLHRQSDAWEHLQARIATFLDQFEQGSESLLRYTGLLPC